MSVNALNVDGGKQFLAFLGGTEAQSVVAEELGRLAVNPDVDTALYNPMQQKGIELINGADLVVQFYDRDTTPEMADLGMNAMMAFWDDPYNETLLDQLLADLEAARQEIFAE
jgi:DNA invertase Pin-like site-specific DNA recombinase